jgi:sporulation protein YlmC with PRC-barrel domain
MANEEKHRRRDEAGVGPDPKQARHLTPLKELTRYKIAKDNADIRGWDVYTSNGRRVGSVDDLLVDTTIGEVVMLDIDLAGSDRHTLAPMRAAWVDRDHDRVILDGAQLSANDELPSLGRTQPSEEELRRFGDSYERTYGDRGFDADRDYRIRQSNEEMRLARRQATSDRAPADAAVPRETVVERRVVSPDEPSWAEGSTDDAKEGTREVRLPADTRVAPGQKVVEEVVVRRRVVDDDELARGRDAEDRDASK